MPGADTVRVRVPATSANLGPGFDALGLALTLRDEVEAWTSQSGLSIEISGEGAELAGAGERHLVVRAMRAAFAVTGARPPGIGLRCLNRIPHGRGLGSSAAAIVAGILAARALSGPGAGKLPDDALLGLAAALEGHPDNVAACLAGGLAIAWTVAGQPRMARLEPRAQVTPVACIAPSPLGTELARRLLPDMVPHRDAAANAGRSALLVAALTERPADAEVLLAATEDRLHQDYRAAAMPDTLALLRSLRAAGIPAVVSGAGPSLLAFLGPREGPRYRHDRGSLGSIVRKTGIAWRVTTLDIERHGARVLRPELAQD
ncbi:MAG: homoserine kinase [Streptosporangiaceae bacterium]|nr:homoserine kinase [Streptosporangiaceae bacterium]